MMVPLIMIVSSFFALTSRVSADENTHRTLPLEASLQQSEEASEVFAILSRSGAASGERTAGLESIFSAVYTLANRVARSERNPLSRNELAELLVDLAESIEYTPLLRSDDGLEEDSVDEDVEAEGSDESSLIDAAPTDATAQAGAALLEELYAQPSHQERVSFVEKLLDASDKLESFFVALFNSVSAVVTGTVDSIQEHLVATISGAAHMLGVNSVEDALEKIEEVGASALHAANGALVALGSATEAAVDNAVETIKEDAAVVAAQASHLAEEAVEVSEEVVEDTEGAFDAISDSETDEDDYSADEDYSADDSRDSEAVVAPLNAHEALLIRAVLNFDQQEVLARSVLVQPDYSAPVNVSFADFCNSLCHQVKRAGLQDSVGKHLKELCAAGSDVQRQEKLYKMLADKQQSYEVCDEVIATAADLVIDQALSSLDALKSSLNTVAATLA